MSAEAARETLTGGRQVGKREAEGGPGPSVYDERNFYVAATDKNHQKTTVRLESGKTMTVPVWLAVEIRRLVEDGLTPYRFEYDVIRDALVHRIVTLNKYRQDPPETWEAFVEMAEMERAASDAHWQQQQVARIKEIMNSALQKGDQDLFRSTHARAEKVAAKLRSPYKEELETFLDVTPLGQRA